MTQLLALEGNASLSQRLAQYVSARAGVLSPRTEEALYSDTRLFVEWCEEHGRPALPARAETIAAFVDDLSTRRAPSSLKRYVASLSHLHRAAGLTGDANPATTQLVGDALRRARKQAVSSGWRQDQALPLRREMVQRLLFHAKRQNLTDIRNRALIMIGYDGMLRASEVVSVEVSDIERSDDGSGVLNLRRSKNDQLGEGASLFLAPDTIAALDTWLSAASVAEGPLFRAITADGRMRANGLGRGDISRLLRAMARRTQLPGRFVLGISGHSLRIGATQDLVDAGYSLPEIMHVGRWRDPSMPLRYVRGMLARESAMAKLAAAQGRGTTVEANL